MFDLWLLLKIFVESLQLISSDGDLFPFPFLQVGLKNSAEIIKTCAKTLLSTIVTSPTSRLRRRHAVRAQVAPKELLWRPSYLTCILATKKARLMKL